MDIFINDIITLIIDDSTWVEQAKTVALLLIHTIFRTLQTLEPLTWDEPLSLHKLAGEGRLEYHMICMGWDTQI